MMAQKWRLWLRVTLLLLLIIFNINGLVTAYFHQKSGYEVFLAHTTDFLMTTDNKIVLLQKTLYFYYFFSLLRMQQLFLSFCLFHLGLFVCLSFHLISMLECLYIDVISTHTRWYDTEPKYMCTPTHKERMCIKNVFGGGGGGLRTLRQSNLSIYYQTPFGATV